eukprot:gnl/Spiro4/22608_TR11154_c0_g1_i1.p2 gnl/Spiro4/22608_TR11154_c0_g1~~gnl/Spiro4/22608_TR11154_c0_g1_i1.p2  ORF type:complete len:197 (-),score=69.72 gnl/Spiro4/22608_TR11154_c0_g1_i1:173-721(-)
MGASLSAWFNRTFSSFSKPQDVLMLGLDAAGKTTILYQLKLGDAITSIPTIGFNVEEVKYKNVTFSVWDIGGQTRIRRLWHHYFNRANGLIYVIDSSDRDRLDEAVRELRSVLSSDQLSSAPLLVFCNKRDLPGALSPSELASALGLTTLRSRPWHVQSACATTGDGLCEGLDWLASALKKK